jgi:hypothetical protein
MEALPHLVQEQRSILIWRQSVSLHWIAAQDFTWMVVQAYQQPGGESKTFYVNGPEKLLMCEALET